MCGIQIAVVIEHGFLVVQHSVPQSSVGIVPERKVGQEVNQGGERHEEYQTKYNCAPGIGNETIQYMFMGESVGAAG